MNRKEKNPISAASIYLRRKQEAAAFSEQRSNVGHTLSAEEIYERRAQQQAHPQRELR